jgi:two-component system chemotaxis sensor kinase CheA
MPERVGQSLVVIVESEGTKLALLVDELVGQQQVVVKSLESNYRKVEGISGATIMGDGRVAMILDVAALIKRSGQTV